jgi:carbon storage regulator CsrA
VRLGIEAPADVTILRAEIVSDIAAENQRAGTVSKEDGESWLKVIGGPRRDEP